MIYPLKIHLLDDDEPVRWDLEIPDGTDDAGAAAEVMRILETAKAIHVSPESGFGLIVPVTAISTVTIGF